MADIQSSDFASALSENVRTDENTSSFKSSCPCRQTSNAFDNSQKLTEYDEYRESEAFSLFPCPHPTCYGENKWYKKLEQHYSSAHKGEECSIEASIKERWRRRGDRMLNKVLSSSNLVSKIEYFQF